MKDLIHFIKTFDGDIWGDYIFSDSIENINDIYCRIDKNLIHIFMRVLSEKYYIIPKFISEFTEENYYLLTNVDNLEEYKSINLYIKTIKKTELSEMVPDFDINSISENNECQWIRKNIPSIQYHGDKYTFIKNRIKEKKFCTIHNFNLIKNIENAIILIKKKWIMDDYFFKNNTWIVSYWFNFIVLTKIIRTASNDHDRVGQNNECIICQTKFLPNDIIINLKCFHTFHWKCYNFTNGGLYEWIKIQSKKNCPTCRRSL